MLDSLSNSFSAGKNTPDAFTDAYSDLKLAYGEQAPIVKEMAIIVSGLHNNFVIEDLLRDMSARCGIDDINSFAETFAVCNRLGGNLKKVVVDSRDTYEYLGAYDKDTGVIPCCLEGSYYYTTTRASPPR